MSHVRFVIPVFRGVDLIDVAAPVDVFSRIAQFWSGSVVEIQVAAETCDAVPTGQTVTLVPTAAFNELDPRDTTVLLVPGAYDVGPARDSAAYIDFLRRHAASAQYVASVCTGALLLGHAGLLDGYRATTHWAGIDTLKAMPRVEVVNGFPRWVHDRNRFTGGGVSSSLDAALKFVSILTGGDQVAKCIQLLIQYHPQPPYDCGDPAVADYDTYRKVAQ